MKLHAESNGNSHEIEIKREDGKVFANVDGRQYELEISEPEKNVLLFKHENAIYEAVVSPAAPGQSTHVRVGKDEFEIKLTDPKRLRGTRTHTEQGEGLAEIQTAMPGKIVRILAQVGTEVEKGDGILVVEAMKMQNELKSPKTGRVKDVRVVEGATVSAGDVLATIE